MRSNPKLTNKDRKQLAAILNLMTDEELEEWLDNLKGRVALRRSGAERECSFCGLFKAGGIAGPKPDLYICPDCIRLAHQLI